MNDTDSKTPLTDAAEIIHQDANYGHYCGGDPRDFHPDGECCTADEIENHKKACAVFDEAEARGETPTPENCPSGWVFGEDGKPLMHILRAPYGIGVTSTEESTGTVPIDFARKLELRINEARDAALKLCYAIEALPASGQQTDLSVQAAALHTFLSPRP